jgi:hypothetical protein
MKHRPWICVEDPCALALLRTEVDGIPDRCKTQPQVEITCKELTERQTIVISGKSTIKYSNVVSGA